FRYHPETSSTSIRKIVEGMNHRMNEFYYRHGFVRRKVALDAAVTKVFVQRIRPGYRTGRRAVASVVHTGGNNSEAFVEPPRKAIYSL
ncbi:hypothetical protein B9Z19DRAFT_979533, partial [Tuber borchii]